MTEQEKRERLEAKQHKRAKRAEKALRHRGFKNFMLVFVGFLMGIVMLVSSVAVFVAVIPVKTYMGLLGGTSEDPAFSENVQDKSFIEALMQINTYQMKDIPILKNVLNELMNGSGLDSIISIDVNGEGFDDIKFVYGEGEGKTFVSELQRYIKIAPTALGDDFASLDVFKTMEVPESEKPTPADMKGIDARIFYYLASGSVAEGNAEYKRAFTDAGAYEEGVDAETKLYYISLSEMSLADVTACVADRFGVTTIRSILECFTDVPNDSVVAKILKDTTVNGIGSFSAEDVLIKDVVDGNEDFYEILEDATGVNRNDISLGDLSDIQAKNIKLTTFIKNSPVLYDVLTDATGVAKENLTVGNLESFSLDNVKLKTVLSSADELYKILSDATGKAETEITIKDLSSISTNNVKLSSVLDDTDSANQTIYKILTDATGKTSAEMTIGDLSSLAVSDIKLSSVLDVDNSANQTIYDILSDATGKTKATITINDLSNLVVGDIKLSRVLEPASSELLYNILKDATGVNAEDLKINDLTGLTTDNIKLSTVMEVNTQTQNLYNILAGATGKTAQEITISDLTTMNVSSIKLNTVMTGGNSDQLLNILSEACSVTVSNLTVGNIENDFSVQNIKIDSLEITSTNTIINALLSAEVNTPEDPVTVGNIGEKIDSLRLNQIFSIDCFTKDVGSTAPHASPAIYQKTVTSNLATYTLYTGAGTPSATNDLYYISNGAAVWLFLLYSYSGDGGNGLATTYVEKSTNFSQLETEFKTASQSMTEGTVRQFYDVGLLGFSTDYSKIYNLSVQDVIEQVANAT